MSSTDEIGTLRAFARSLDLVQPFRQVWRETYVPNTAERSMELYSSHYAGHILRFRQFYALARERGWWGGFLSGAWDGGQSGIANRDFRVAGIRASWQLAMLDFDDHRIEIELGVTDRLIFAQIGENEQAPLALSDVPSVVFSEAMRDLDLFTSVCTVANDPFWIEKFAFEPRLGEYWEALAHGEHLDAVHHRRELLEAMEICPSSSSWPTGTSSSGARSVRTQSTWLPATFVWTLRGSGCRSAEKQRTGLTVQHRHPRICLQSMTMRSSAGF